MKRSRAGISEDSYFTTDEIEVAGIITCFHHYWRLFLQWGAKCRRSAFRREESRGTHNSKLFPVRNENERDGELQHGGMAIAQSPERRLSLTSSHLNSKNARTKNRPKKREPKKKTHRELTEKVDELSLEKATLIEEVEQVRKRRQVLKDYSMYLKSELALCLEQWQEQNVPYISHPPSSFHSDTSEKTETVTSCDDFQIYDEHGDFEKYSGSSALGSIHGKPQRLGRPMYPCSSESSFVVENDGAVPTKDTVCSGFHVLNVPDEGTNISNDQHHHNQMAMSKNKAAMQR